MSTLLLFNPGELPFGNLSPLKDNIISKSYSSLVDKETVKKDIASLYSDNAKKESLEYFTLLQDNIYISSLKKALDVKYKTEGIAQQSLLLIDQDYIVYDSPNLFLKDFIGKYLMQLRDELKKDELKKEIIEKKNYVNKVYSVFKALKEDFLACDDDLSKYINKSIDEILQMRYIENNSIPIIDITKMLGMNPEYYSEINYFLV